MAEDVGVLLTNNRGKDVAYFGVENILVRTTEDGVTQSGQQIFTKGEAIEGVEINLALNDGDQTIKAPEGYLVKSAIIKKPDTLIPENIVKDVEIAGVIGTHVGSGSGGGSSGEIFPLQTVEEFAQDGMIYFANSPEFLPLKEGETYYVEWDGEEFPCVCKSTIFDGAPALYIGNSYLVGDSTNSGEPFVIGSIDIIGASLFVTLDSAPTHDIRIYQKKGYIEYVYDENGVAIAARAFGFESLPKYTFNNSTIRTLDLSGCPKLTQIEEYACYQSSLRKVILPASLTDSGESAFGACTYLTSVYFLGTLSQWLSMNRNSTIGYSTSWKLYIGGEEVDWSTVEIPSDVTAIGAYAFAYAPITNLTIPNTVIHINNYAFYNCSSLTSIVIPDSVTSIGNYAFYNCSSLESVIIGNSVTSIGNSAFAKCTALKSVVIPDSVTTLGSTVFQNSSNLTSVTFGSGITSMGSAVLSYGGKLSSLTLKEGLSVIGDSFIGEYGDAIPLTSVVIPASVKKIGKNAFTKATKLANATFTDPNGWYVSTSSYATSGTSVTLTNAATAATYLRSNYKTYYWYNGD